MLLENWCLDPSEFGPHGHRREAIANAYEDHLNDVPMANLITTGLEEFAEFIFNDAHLANTVIAGDINLPDAPTFLLVLAHAPRELAIWCSG